MGVDTIDCRGGGRQSIFDGDGKLNYVGMGWLQHDHIMMSLVRELPSRSVLMEHVEISGK